MLMPGSKREEQLILGPPCRLPVSWTFKGKQGYTLTYALPRAGGCSKAGNGRSFVSIHPTAFIASCWWGKPEWLQVGRIVMFWGLPRPVRGLIIICFVALGVL